MGPLLSLGAHVIAAMLVAVPLLWATWRQYNQEDFRLWRTAAKIALFALMSWLVAYGIEMLVRQSGYVGSTYPPQRRQTAYMLIERDETRQTPFPTVTGND